jgi:hypothetical protein
LALSLKPDLLEKLGLCDQRQTELYVSRNLFQKILTGLRKAGFGFGGFCVMLFGLEFFCDLL